MKKPSFWTSSRFYASSISTALMNLKLFGFSLRGVCTPGMNCHGCPWATAACPVGVMAYGSAVHAFPALAVGLILAIGIVCGRLVCSFLCPFGLLQDLLHKIPSPKLRLPRWWRFGRYLALLLLVVSLPALLGFGWSGVLVVQAPRLDQADGGQLRVGVTLANHGTEPIAAPEVDLVWVAKSDGAELGRSSHPFPDLVLAPGESRELPAILIPSRLGEADLQARSPQSLAIPRAPLTYYCAVCPVGALEATLPALAGSDAPAGYSAHTWIKLGILAVFLLLMVPASRPFCRGFCPLGAIYSLCSALAWWRVEVEASKCTQCGACSRACPVELDLPREIGSKDCIACGDCISACPGGGIRRRFGWR